MGELQLQEAITRELDGLAQALTGVACAAQLMKDGDVELLTIIRTQTVRAIESQRLLVELFRAVRALAEREGQSNEQT